MSMLLNSDGALRSGWRYTIYVAVFTVLLFANAAVMALVLTDPTGDDAISLLGINAWALLAPAVLTLAFMIRFVDHVPVATFGVALHEKWGRDLGLGLLVAALMIVLYDVFAFTLGELNIQRAASDNGFWMPLILTVFFLTVSAANEELVFRGYPLQVLMVAIGPWGAMVAMSALFGLGHYQNPGSTWLGTLNTFLAGMVLSLAYFRTRSLWFPYGIHIGWNLAIGPIFGFRVSGITMPSLWNSEVGGADWVVGGAYGPEGGVLGTGVMIAAIVAVRVTRKVEISATLRSLLKEHAGKFYGVRCGGESDK